MTKERNLKALALGGELVATHDFDRFGEFFAEHIVDHDPGDGQGEGLAGTKQYWRSLLESFPDFALAPEVVLADDDDNLTLVLRVSGTHQGEYMGHAADGSAIRGPGPPGGPIRGRAHGRALGLHGHSGNLDPARTLGMTTYSATKTAEVRLRASCTFIPPSPARQPAAQPHGPGIRIPDARGRHRARERRRGEGGGSSKVPWTASI